MSEQDVALKVAEILKKPLREAAEGAVDLRMKELPGIVQKELEGLPGIVRKEMDACLDGKCDAIAERLVAKLPKPEASTLPDDLMKTIKAAMEEGQPPFKVEGHTAHDILDCPTCRPVVVDKLWEDEGYRKTMAEKVCEDEECRNLFIKQFEAKGFEVKEVKQAGGEDESWADKRLREIRERSSS